MIQVSERTATVIHVRSALKHVLYAKCERFFAGSDGKVALDGFGGRERPAAAALALVKNILIDVALFVPVHRFGEVFHVFQLKAERLLSWMRRGKD